MAEVLTIQIPNTAQSRRNLDLGLSTGRWAFPLRTPSPDARKVKAGHLVLFGVGGSPRGGGQFPGWATRSLTEAHVARVVKPPFKATGSLFWPDEVRQKRRIYNPTIEIEYLGPLGGIPLAPGVSLSQTVSEALYRSGVSHQVFLLPTSGSPGLAPFTPSAGSPVGSSLPGAGAIVGPAATGSGVRLVKIEKQKRRISVIPPGTPKIVVRREQDLVHGYRDLLEAKGRTVSRLAVPLPTGGTMYNDLVDVTARHLVEAKGACTRDAVRIAIGQLADYGRFWSTLAGLGAAPVRRAVLLPQKPDADLLDLLSSQSVDVVWRGKGGFHDNAGGALV